MKPVCRVAVAALLMGMAASADDAKALNDFFAKCYQRQALGDAAGLTREIEKAPPAARASYRYLYYQTVAFYLNHQSEEARKHADITLQTLIKRKAKESTIATVQEALKEWAAWDNDRIRAKSREYGGGYTRFLLSEEEEEAKSRDIFTSLAKKNRRDSTSWKPDVRDTHWGKTPETSGALLNALYKDDLQLPPEAPPQPIELPADEGASPSAPQ